jgi:hypothetical protein
MLAKSETFANGEIFLESLKAILLIQIFKFLMEGFALKHLMEGFALKLPLFDDDKHLMEGFALKLCEKYYSSLSLFLHMLIYYLENYFILHS